MIASRAFPPTARVLLVLACLLCPAWVAAQESGQRETAQEKRQEKREEEYAAARLELVAACMEGRGIDDPRLLKAMRGIPRHLFVPPAWREWAYKDMPLPIGHGQTISQPSLVAFMTQALGLKGGEKVLEIGAGSGYQAAVLSRLAQEVYTVEIVPELAQEAGRRLAELGYANVRVKAGDGWLGWPERAPFQAIMVTAAPEEIPPLLVEQLAPMGRMVLPVGAVHAVQQLTLVEKDKDGRVKTAVLDLVRFVPMIKGR